MKEVTLTLTLQAYNTIVMALQEMPWKVAHPVLTEIDPQVRAALTKETPKDSTPSVAE